MTSIPLVSHHPRGFSGYGLSDPANHIVHLLPTRSSRYFVVGICRTSSFAQLLDYSAPRHLFSRAFATCGHLQRPPRVFSSCSSTSCREQMITHPMLPPITSVGGCFPKAPRIFDQDAQPPRRGRPSAISGQRAIISVSSPRLELPICSDPVYQSTAFAHQAILIRIAWWAKAVD